MKKSKISVKGANLQNFLNALQNRKIVVKNLVFNDDNLIFETEFKNVDKLVKLFNNSNYEIKILSNPKYKNNKEFILKNLGILIALFFVVVSCLCYSQHIWQYKIYGNDIVDSNSIIEVLKANGAKIGVSKNDIDVNNIENALQQNIDNIALSSINIVGTTLIITINEKIDNTDLLDNTKAIVSNYDCVITSIKTIAGTALVKVGDKVAKGETLIGNYVVDNSGQMTPSKAVGEIYADVYYTYTKTYFESESVLERSGKTYCFNDINILGLKINSKNKSKFSNYEIETKSYYLDSFIPILVTQNKVYELVEKQVNNDLNDIDNLIKNTTELGQKQYNLSEYDNVITNVSKGENNVTISVSFVINKKIV